MSSLVLIPELLISEDFLNLPYLLENKQRSCSEFFLGKILKEKGSPRQKEMG